MNEILWQPTAAQIEATEVARWCRDLGFEPDYSALHAWSVEDIGRFWGALWDRFGVVGDQGDVTFSQGERFRTASFFETGSLNIAENLLAANEVDPDTHVAMSFSNEDGPFSTLTVTELRERVSLLQQAMRRAGVGVGDVVAAWLPNLPDTIAIFLAANSLGAVFTSGSPDFGTNGVVDRFGQLDPKLLFATDEYLYAGKRHSTLERLSEVTARLPSLEETILVPYLNGAVDVDGATTLDAFCDGLSASALHFERLPFDHPAFVLFSSGTTGAPKAIVHRGGGVFLKLLSEHRIHCDIGPGDRVFYFTTAGWMMWNWLAVVLASDATLLLFDGSPFHPDPDVLFDLADREQATLFGVSAKYVDALNKANRRPAESHDLSTIRTICSTGSTLVHESFEYLYEHVKSDVHVASFSGGTDLCGCLVSGAPSSAVRIGEIQAPCIGLDIQIFDDDGAPLPPGEQGELVCTTPFPSIPLRFVGDENNERFDDSYFDRFDGSWHQGDFAEWTDAGGMIIHGRSDATLNPGGVRIGTAEIYRQVEQLDEILEGIVIGQSWDNDTRVVLFVRLADGATLDDELISTIKRAVREGASPRHVPAKVLEVSDIPRTRSGKISELAVRSVVHGRSVKNTEALANPESLEQFANRPELDDEHPPPRSPAG